MMEKFLNNTETIKRWKKLKSNKKAVVASWFFLFFLFLSVTAEFWSNSKPIIMSYQGTWYFPALVHYHPSDLNLETDLHVVDYKSLNFSKSDWAFWPLVKWDPFESNTKVDHYPSPPSADNWLGTDDRGRDILSRLIYGFRYSMGFALMVWCLSYLLGTFLGALMGFAGGWLDLIGQRCVEIIETVPFFIAVDYLSGLSRGSFFLAVSYIYGLF